MADPFSTSVEEPSRLLGRSRASPKQFAAELPQAAGCRLYVLFQQFEESPPNGRVQFLSILGAQAVRLDETLNVCQVLKSPFPRHAGRQFELDECFEIDDLDTLHIAHNGRRIGERYGLGLSVTRILPGNKEFKPHARFRIAHVPAAAGDRDVSTTKECFTQPVPRYQQVNIFRESPDTMHNKRIAADKRMGDV